MQTKALILVADGFQEEEFVYPYYRMLEAGWAVSVYPGGVGKYGIKAVANTTPAIHASELPWDCVIVPGGWQSPELVRQMPDCLNILRSMDARGRCIGAICHGPWALISAGIMKGRRATCYKGMKDDMVNAGADYMAASVVVIDRNLITAPHYRNNPEFMRAVIERVSTQQHKDYRESHAL